ncbi:MAG: ABC transporter substrate-binding protein [Chloroflexales bacterium]|nr:ABC transporter substrate-binding protein [Chloroflexales bacterium]
MHRKLQKSLMLLSAFMLLVLVTACQSRPSLEEELAAAEQAEAAPGEETAAEAPGEEAAAETAEMPAETTKASSDTNSAFREAPELADLVAAGELPPVEERLPENPLVVEPVESIGRYGGTWQRAFLGIKDFHAFGRITYEPMLRWPRDPSDPVQPGLAERWEWNSAGTELTLYLRKGLKWSDGEPFTTADITFWWEDIENDENVTPAGPHAEWIVGGEPMELDIIDDTAITLKFAAPNGLAETIGLAFHGNQWPLGFERFGFFAPRHYLEQFHPAYNADLNGNYTQFEDKAFDFNPERPAMTPWRITEFEAGATQMAATRNPYYWKVDPEGNQLPYIDRVLFTLVEDREAINLMGISGNIDMQTRNMDFNKIQVFQENAEASDFRIGLWSSANASQITFFPNQSYSDEKYRELMSDLRFRQALSLAIDRDLINEVSFLGQGVPSSQTVVRASALYQADIPDTYMQFDPAAAATLLDEIGLPLGEGGFRTFPDGTPIELIVETSFASGADLDAVEIAVENWQEIGLNTAINAMSRDIYWPRATGNESMIAVWSTDRGLVPMVDPIYQFPFDERSWMGPLYGIWYKSSGELGEAPPAHFKELMDLYDAYRGTIDPAEQAEIAKEIVRLASERLYAIGTVGEAPNLVVIKNNIKNVIEEDFTADWIIMAPGTQDPSQYYFDNE